MALQLKEGFRRLALVAGAITFLYSLIDTILRQAALPVVESLWLGQSKAAWLGTFLGSLLLGGIAWGAVRVLGWIIVGFAGDASKAKDQ